MQYIKQIMLLVILTISWKCQAEEVKEIWLDELGESWVAKAVYAVSILQSPASFIRRKKSVSASKK